uniref:Uncharacterized protein n=1 Tax=Knipowitschia caucasica TaxID=637954 RepID=A0AAV2KR33_KNICA
MRLKRRITGTERDAPGTGEQEERTHGGRSRSKDMCVLQRGFVNALFTWERLGGSGGASGGQAEACARVMAPRGWMDVRMEMRRRRRRRRRRRDALKCKI